MMKSLNAIRGRNTRFAATALVAAGLITASAAAGIASAAAAGQPSATAATAAAQTPWSKVGTGWTLAMYTSSANRAGPTTLYLVSPAGSKYAVHTWQHGTNWNLVAMSPAGNAALFQNTSVMTGKTRAYLMNLKSGATSSFRLPQSSLLIGYGPGGTSVLVGTRASIYRYSLTGARLASLTHAAFGDIDYSVTASAIVMPGSKDIVIADNDGLLVVRPSGKLVRYLPVGGTNGACTPVRLKTGGVILAYCVPDQASSGPQVHGVPVNGNHPWVITAVRDFNGADYGDTDAWSLGGKTFVQGEPGCGPEFLGLQHKNGTVTPLSMPGDASGSVVDASTGDEMMITRAGCEGFSILMRFDPVTGQSRMVFNGKHGAGAYAVVADNRNGTQP